MRGINRRSKPRLATDRIEAGRVQKDIHRQGNGAHVKRPELAKCLKALKAGDILVVWKLDRLGRSLHDLIGLLDDLKTRGVAFRSVTESIERQHRQAVPCGKWSGYWRSLKGR